MKREFIIEVYKINQDGEIEELGEVAKYNRSDIAYKVFFDLCEELTSFKICEFHSEEQPKIAYPKRRYSLRVKFEPQGSESYELDYFII